MKICIQLYSDGVDITMSSYLGMEWKKSTTTTDMILKMWKKCEQPNSAHENDKRCVHSLNDRLQL